MKAHVAFLCLLLAACAPESPPADGASAAHYSLTAAACDSAAVRATVTLFGSRLAHVALLAPDAPDQIRENYSDLVAAPLLAAWTASPASAPGRNVSSPTPDRILIDSITPSCGVRGRVVYVTSTDTAAWQQPIELQLADSAGWRIVEVAFPVQDTATGDVAAAVDVINSYYVAINKQDYRAAYELWSDSGRASGASYEDFAAGYADTREVSVTVGEASRIEPAAGSRYITVPVAITATMKNGGTQRFSGTYVLRRSVVDGAPPAQRTWHIYEAAIGGNNIQTYRHGGPGVGLINVHDLGNRDNLHSVDYDGIANDHDHMPLCGSTREDA